MNQVTVEKNKLDELYTQSYSYILDTILKDRRLLLQDAENLAQSLAAHLDDYDGPIEPEPFRQWADGIIAPAAERLSTFYRWRHEYRNSVMSGVWSVLRHNLDLDSTNPTAIAERIEQDAWFWVLRNMENLLVPGRAKLSTRLYAQGKFHALTWRKSRLRAMERFDDSDVERYGRTEMIEVDGCGNIGSDYQQFYDPGGHEDDPEDEARPQTINLPIPSPSDSQVAMRSGTPRLFCPVCKALQDISPDPPVSDKATKLVCGHERPALLPKMAAALKE